MNQPSHSKVFLQVLKTYLHTKSCTFMFIIVTFIITKSFKPFKFHQLVNGYVNGGSSFEQNTMKQKRNKLTIHQQHDVLKIQLSKRNELKNVTYPMFSFIYYFGNEKNYHKNKINALQGLWVGGIYLTTWLHKITFQGEWKCTNSLWLCYTQSTIVKFNKLYN